MRGRLWTVFAAAVAAAMLFGCAAKTDYGAMITGVQDNFTSIRSYQLTPSLYIPEAGTDVQVQASFQSPNKMKAEVVYPISITIVCDGKKLSGCVPDYNTCLSLPLDKNDGPIPTTAMLRAFTPHLNYVGFMDKYDYTVEGKEELDGKKAILFKLTRKSSPEMSFQAASAKMWLDEENGLPMKVEMYNDKDSCKTRAYLSNYAQFNGVWMPQDLRMETGDGMVLATMSITDIKVNEDIPASNFTFTPPSDAVVLDELPPVGDEVPEILLLD